MNDHYHRSAMTRIIISERQGEYICYTEVKYTASEKRDMQSKKTNTKQSEQLRYELETWLRTLNYIQQENIYLKTRLARVIESGIDDTQLEQVEYFQNHFVNKDAVIALLRQDIAKEQKLNGELASRSNLSNHENLRRDMELMEKEFNRLKFDFNSYLSKNIN